MTKLVVGKFLDATDSLLVKELHIVASITKEEVISTHAQPEQMNLPVGISSLVINIGNISRRKRTVRAQVGELIEIRQTIIQRLITST